MIECCFESKKKKNVFLPFTNGDKKYKKGINKNRNSFLKK